MFDVYIHIYTSVHNKKFFKKSMLTMFKKRKENNNNVGKELETLQ